LSALGPIDIKQVTDELERHEEEIMEFAKKWLSRPSNRKRRHDVLPESVSLLYLCYYLALQRAAKLDRESAISWLRECLPFLAEVDVKMLYELL
jgi:hypothetical protein